MEVDPVHFGEVLEESFQEALRTTRTKIREAFVWLRCGDRYYAEPANWAFTALDLCWHGILRAYGRPPGDSREGKAFSRRDMNGVWVELKNIGLSPFSRVFVPDITMDGRMAIDSAVTGSRVDALAVPDEMPVLLVLLDKAVPSLLPRADAEMREAFGEALNLHARYAIVRQALQAFARERKAGLKMDFDAVKEELSVSFNPKGWEKDIAFGRVPLDDMAHFLDWLPAYYDDKLSNRDYRSLH